MYRPFHIKSEIRVLAIDDSALIADQIMIVGAFFRGGGWLDGVMRSYVTRDGMDSTDTIAEMILSSKHCGQIRIIMLDGVTYAGFNPVDIHHIWELTGIPVVAVMRSYPNFRKIEDALFHLPEPQKRMGIILRAGGITKVRTGAGPNHVYIQCAGIEAQHAARIVQLTATRSNIPEPLRVAHLIATGIVLGESRGKA
ncbi:DUF99 family protein [Methanomethylovorans sp.]|uniref:endonuclease dU n=1 Tax=Methanomethylovorans sp. TaxID=2758717 RepID=UPI00351C7B93